MDQLFLVKFIINYNKLLVLFGYSVLKMRTYIMLLINNIPIIIINIIMKKYLHII